MFFILLCSLVIYCSYPFINGSGCDFYAETEDDVRAINMSCFAGILTTVYQKKTTGDIFVTKSLFGKRGDTIYLVNYNARYELGKTVLRKIFLPKFINDHYFSSYKLFHGIDGEDIVVSDAPVYSIYQLDRTGALSWL
ncbi:hypothetical protein [Aeromonas dhakensis]|uniref:hypothetical protein n=1 Tax=Aeromonas dhakensis TaxID=196024 RepID=UPI0021B34408|nr:hypothetical protein [Aeromonas dhakensis]